MHIHHHLWSFHNAAPDKPREIMLPQINLGKCGLMLEAWGQIGFSPIHAMKASSLLNIVQKWMRCLQGWSDKIHSQLQDPPPPPPLWCRKTQVYLLWILWHESNLPRGFVLFWHVYCLFGTSPPFNVIVLQSHTREGDLERRYSVWKKKFGSGKGKVATKDRKKR